MIKTFVPFVFFSLFAGIKDVHPQTEKNINAIDKTITEYFDASMVKGMSVSIVGRNSLLLSRGYGQNLGNKITPKTPLYIGSTTKVITGLATILLIEQEKLKPTDNLKMYFTDCPDYLENITIKDLLHHHSGISQLSGYNSDLEYQGNLTAIETHFAPGEKGIYSSANSILLGMIIEKVSELPYGRFVEEQIFQPLDMVDSYVPTPNEGTDIKGYTFAYGPLLKSRQMDYGKYVIPAGYVVSTTHDLAKLCQMFLNKGKIRANGTEKTFLKEETINAIFTPYKGSEFGYGMAWGIGVIEKERAYSHEGMTKISNANIVILPDEGVAIACIVNANSGPFFSLASEVTSGIINEINGVRKKSNIPKGNIYSHTFWGALSESNLSGYKRWSALERWGLSYQNQKSFVFDNREVYIKNRTLTSSNCRSKTSRCATLNVP